MLHRIVVVGASLAGLRAVEALRRRGYDGALTLVGAEPQRPYDRPPLSKQLLRSEWSVDRLWLRKRPWEELAVDLRLGVEASELVPRDRTLRLADGSALRYDGLVIATGASPRRLPFGHELAGVHVLRTLDDAQALAAQLAERPRVCVVGAGFIGLEVAASCRQLGLPVCAVEASEVPLAERLGPRMARWIFELHREAGVEFHTGVTVRAFEGERRVTGVQLSNGERRDADLVVVGIGVTPNTGWLAGSGLDVRDGVECDATCATSAPHVVAAGDVARWPHPLFDERMRVEHWTNAVEQAAAAADRLLAGPDAATPFAPVPYFWSDQYDVKIQFAGSARASDELHVVEDDLAGRKLRALYERQGRVVGALTVGRPAQLIKYRRMILQRASLDAALSV